MKRLAILVAIVASFAVIANGYALPLQVLEVNVAGTGGVYGSAYFPIQNAFDAQGLNSYNEATGMMTGSFPGPQAAPYYTGRWGQIDLGPDWADWRIKETWTQWRAYSGLNNPQIGYVEGFYTSIDSPNLSWPGPFANADIVIAPVPSKLNFVSGNVPHDGNINWTKDVDNGTNEANWETPAGRYLIIHLNSTDGGRANEYAFVGYIVPEPATMVLLAMGGVGMLLRKRR